MYHRSALVRKKSPISVLSSVILGASLLYIFLDYGTFLSDLPEVFVPLVVSLCLAVYAVRLRSERYGPDQLRRIVNHGWFGAAAATLVGLWWVVLHLQRELPVGSLSDQILTVWSIGIGAGVLVGSYRVGRRSVSYGGDRDRLLAEATWTDRSEPNPVLLTVVEQIAELEGVDPIELDSLYDAIDTDVLAELPESSSQWQLLFYVGEYEVRVSGHGTVSVYALDRSKDGRASTVTSR